MAPAAMVRPPGLAARTLACALGAAAASAPLDAVALVQRSVAQTASAQWPPAAAPGPVRRTAGGPVASTPLGPIVGREEDDHFSFRGIPYAERPRRFERAQPKQPWGAEPLDGRDYEPGCIGSATSFAEREDCLHLNVWLPKGGQRGMPVIVYFHGGLNMHGSGAESLRQGDGVTQSSRYPTIFVNFDYRLGIFGWIYGARGDGIENNIGFTDQQEALRWVHQNIAGFGGDPNKVTLMGQSEGAANIMTHLISPGSAGLFHRAIFHSPPAELWSHDANRARTAAMVQRSGCARLTMRASLECLKAMPADKLWSFDWVPEDLSRDVYSEKWKAALGNLASFALAKDPASLVGYLGWHPIVDGVNIPGEVHDLIPQGKWNKVPILVTVSKNESLGVLPGAASSPLAVPSLQMSLGMLVKQLELPQLLHAYDESLKKSGIVDTSQYDLLHQMLTDKLWTCEAWNLAKEISQGGGSVQLGMFWHSPRYDPVGTLTNKVCAAGATCHASEMLYSLPQGHGRGIVGWGPEMLKEQAFVTRYRDEVLSFVHGFQGPWEPYRPDRQVITFYDESGARVVEGYRKPQCAILDRSMASKMPAFMRRRAQGF